MGVMATLYTAIKDGTFADNDNAAIAEYLDWDVSRVRLLKSKLKAKGVIASIDGVLTAIAEYKELGTGPSTKHSIYTEMLDYYMEDFRQQTNFTDRMRVGREIRLLLERM